MAIKDQLDEELSFYSFFVPLTTKKITIFLILIGFAVYLNMLFNGFVWDDITYIIWNNELHHINIIELFSNNSFNSSGYYRPIPAVYFALLYGMFGVHSFYYHFFQLSLHILDSVLLFFLLKKFFPKTISFLLTTLFIIHPIQVESVTYIGASQSELFFLFGVTAFLISLKKKLQSKDYILISGLLLLSLLTKETGVLFIFIILLYQLIFRWRNTLKMTPFICISIITYIIIRFGLAGIIIEHNNFIPLGKFSFLKRLISIPEIVFYYIKTLFYPAQLSIDQLWKVDTVNFQHFYFPLIIDILFFSVIGLFGYYIYKVQKDMIKLYIFFLCWFCLGLSMLLQLFPLDMTVADRWFYFPIVGLLGMLGIAIGFIQIKNEKVKNTIYILIVVALIVLSIRSIIRNRNWINEITLYSHDVQISDNFDIENNLGAQLAIAKRYKEALPHIKKSVDLYPHATNIYNLGYDSEQLGDLQTAKKNYEIILTQYAYSKNYEEVLKNAYDGMARIIFLHDKPEISKSFLLKALKKYPDNGTFWAYLAISQYRLHEQGASLTSAENAKRLLPNTTTNKLYQRIKNKQEINIVKE